MEPFVELSAADLQQIHNLIHRYCWHIDHGDFDAMAALFADAEFVVPAGAFVNDPAALAAMFREWVRLYPDGTPRTRHVTTNVIVDAETPERASANSVVTVFQQTDELPLQPIIGTRNFDRFRKVDGRWRFAFRRIEIGQVGDLSAHLKQTLP